MPKTYDSNNIFAKILAGDIPARKAHETETVLAFDDIHPQASVHALVIPKGAYADLTSFAEHASDKELADWVRGLVQVAQLKGVAETGYRVIVNCGADANQEVPHLHGHVLGGVPLGAMMPTKRGERG